MSKSPVAERIGQGAIITYVVIAIFIWGLGAWMIINPRQEPTDYVECAICHEKIDENYARLDPKVCGPVCMRCDR
jgi:hypothetical protein